MLLGLRAAIYPVGDLAKAKAWYAQVVGSQPYFDQPFYVGFSVGGYELGLVPDGTPGMAGPQPLWGVANADRRSSGSCRWAPRRWSPSPTSAKASRSPR